MPTRFCSQCGTEALAGAKFCAECGASLGQGVERGGLGRWRATATGSTVLGFFLVAGLTIWTVILSPAPPQPGPGGAAPPGASARAAGPASRDLPAGNPAPPLTLPAEVTSFIADLSAKAKQKPEDVESWMRLAQVTTRAARFDPSYSAEALAAFRHVLDRDPKNPEALHGAASIHYDRDEHREAVPFYERYLAQKPDDASARTDLGTMYLSLGDAALAMATYREVIRRSPSFLQAHYNLAVTHHRQGAAAAALAELEIARGLASEDGVRKQIDDTIARLRGERPPPASAPGDGLTPADRSAAATPRSAFQGAVEEAFRGHPIMGPRIVRFEWSTPAAGRVLMRDFPMEAMPPAVREKFTARLVQAMQVAREAHPVDGPLRMEIADAASGVVMGTVTP